jgi:hypothetical protein
MQRLDEGHAIEEVDEFLGVHVRSAQKWKARRDSPSRGMKLASTLLSNTIGHLVSNVVRTRTQPGGTGLEFP